MIYRGVRLSLCPKVYRPSDDSFLLADNVLCPYLLTDTAGYFLRLGQVCPRNGEGQVRESFDTDVLTLTRER